MRMMTHEQYLYPPNKTIPRTWGPIPYSIKTNNLGFRGNNYIERNKPKGTYRAAAVGDSITDGFFVDNADTYPVILEELLSQNHAVEIINSAKGGGSIQKQYAIYRQYVQNLNPDLVILTFVSNDLNDLKNLSREELLHYKIKTESNNIINWSISNTALGEVALHTFLSLWLENYTTTQDLKLIGDPKRYQISNNSEYLSNAEHQVTLSKKWGNLVLDSPESELSQRKLHDYLYILNHFNETIIQDEAQLLFVYYPSYSQIYLDNVPDLIKQQLEKFCREHKIAFLDLTDPFQNADRSQPLHLAPLDFHPNPNGNKLIALTIASFIEKHFFYTR